MQDNMGVPASQSGIPNAVNIARLRAGFQDATAKALDPNRPEGAVTLSGSTVFALLDAAGQFLTFGASAIRRCERASIAAFLRQEAAETRFAQARRPEVAEKLYRMGQKDGLLLAAVAIEAGHHDASGIEAPSGGETHSGSAEGESPVGEAETPNG